MKILIVQDYLRSGGTERQAVFLANAFAALSHEVVMLTFRPGGALADSVATAVRRVALQNPDRNLDWWALGLAQQIRTLGPDVILCMGRMANCWAGRLVRTVRQAGLRARVLATMRTGKPLPWLFRRSLRAVDHIVANSSDSQRVLVDRYKIGPDKISVIHNGIVALPEVAPEFGRDAASSDREIVMLHVGMFRPEKNQRELIEVCRDLPRDIRWRLELAGEGVELDRCRALAQAVGLGDRVTFCGYCPQPQILYRRADLAVLTSKSESLSNFLIEAHAHGLPSVAYRAAGVDECGGISVAAGDRTAFRAALLPLLKDPAYRARESARVREFALRRFSPEAQTEAYLKLFERLLS